MTKKQETENKDLSRRDFLSYAWLAAGAFVLAEGGALTFKFLSPRIGEGSFGGLITVGNAEDFPPGSVTLFTEGRFYLVRMEDEGFVALYRKCTHLGCAVPWEPAEQKFICPCHASEFERDGNVLNPPAPRPLDRFPIIIEDAVIKVDTGDVITRDKTSDDDRVYV